MENPFAINPEAKVAVNFIGHERQPVIVVDDLLCNPESILLCAENSIAFQRPEQEFYPGLRKPLTSAYAEPVYRFLADTFWTVFSNERDMKIKLLSSVLSLTTTKPENLRPIQTVPHFDSFNPNQIAAVHYFCHPHQGGTAFYRHKQTGYESIDKQRLSNYAPQVKSEVMHSYTGQSAYINQSTDYFEKIYAVEAKFNRAIFYRSNILHSGNIKETTQLTENPREGRLTANTLVLVG